MGEQAAEIGATPRVRLTGDERERLRLWLYEHNGSMGPDPITEGAGGLAGLWTVVEEIMTAQIEAVIRRHRPKMEASDG